MINISDIVKFSDYKDICLESKDCFVYRTDKKKYNIKGANVEKYISPIFYELFQPNFVFDLFQNIKDKFNDGKEDIRLLIDELKEIPFIKINLINYTKLSYVFFSLDSIITILFQVTVFIIFAKQVYLNKISIGKFTMINTYFNFIISSIKYFMSLGKSYQDVRVSKNRLEEIISQHKEHNGDQILNSIETITVENISFSYENDQKDKVLVLDNLNLFLKANYIYLIKGKNGSGKSTLFDIIIGIYQQEIESGTIKFNDQKIELIDMYKFRRDHIGFVSQTIYYGGETVLEFLASNFLNKELLFLDSRDYVITETQRDSTESLGNRIISKIKEYKMEDFFINNSFNIVDLFNRKMQELSGGQRQKVLILREILKNPDILFFDEPTSSLDQKSILDLKKVIQNIKKEKIILITSHEDHFDDIADEEINLI